MTFVVKVQAAPTPAVYTQDRKLFLLAPAGFVAKRLHPREAFAYFNAEYAADGVLEIGERVPAPEVPW